MNNYLTKYLLKLNSFDCSYQFDKYWYSTPVYPFRRL